MSYPTLANPANFNHQSDPNVQFIFTPKIFIKAMANIGIFMDLLKGTPSEW